MAYHHGDLRRVLLEATAEAIEENGVAALSMRDLARRAGVSHAAPTHHFGDKAGLLTAFAAEGYEQLAQELAGGSFLEMGVAYVRFALTRRAQFEVMYRPDLYHADDPALVAARAKSAEALYDRAEHGNQKSAGDGIQSDARNGNQKDARITGQAGWSIAHGFATLWLSGAFPDRDQDPIALARALFQELNRAPEDLNRTPEDVDRGPEEPDPDELDRDPEA
ncbi:TetR/AcrR family transcriptional regulator [Actinoplanes sp. LDG1-06]|uniref:TetR/AcrR family transcriptional regulator n=1 Tax=Paractinoplanes ovalisporus TaxID=2810368 RepID=A0ABS2AQK7_9ACTN|nr:TetR/AcrR family transcriptional regulator [Actinoplanes ovalisporus]MBM2622154.1 TetR/AcrR family transcriptional regulator [Actinoplanes ovalisporus]